MKAGLSVAASQRESSASTLLQFVNTPTISRQFFFCQMLLYNRFQIFYCMLSVVIHHRFHLCHLIMIIKLMHFWDIEEGTVGETLTSHIRWFKRNDTPNARLCRKLFFV